VKIELNGSELLYLLTGEGVLQPETVAVLDRLRFQVVKLRDDEDPKPAEHDWSPNTTPNVSIEDFIETFQGVNDQEPAKLSDEQPEMIDSPTLTILSSKSHGKSKKPELDTDGIPWDERIHATSKAKLKDGRWRRRRNLDDETFERIKQELLSAKPSIDTACSEPQAPPPPPPPETDPPMDFGKLMSLATEKGFDYPKLNEWAKENHKIDGVLLAMKDQTLFNEIYNELLAIKTE
jgi:hypothetical protein